jgi:hypothetical protein
VNGPVTILQMLAQPLHRAIHHWNGWACGIRDAGPASGGAGPPRDGTEARAGAVALAGTALLLAVVRAVPLRSVLMVPLIGIMLGGVVLRGSYEMLWMALAIVVAAYVPADRFTVAETGEAFPPILASTTGELWRPAQY